MTAFYEYFRERLAEFEAFPTGDVLASFLPLGRQVAEAHAAGRVAPLAGLEALQVDEGRIWYENLRESPPLLNPVEVERLTPKRGGLVVLSERRITRDVGIGEINAERVDVGRRGEPLSRPLYLPGYVSWEHEIKHHDPLTDTFSLGLILASLACGLDLNDEQSLERFVQHRGNLFQLNAGLHPVIARAVVAMTELDRHRRPQDLPALLDAIENYREQSVDFDLELKQDTAFEGRDRRGKQQVVLGKLQERLFEISRRNRLLEFRSTMHTVNLTHASMPLAMDISKVGDSLLVTWGGNFRKDVLSQKPIPLNRYLNFREAIYLPSALDGIRVEASRDSKEFGFAQLRLIVAFLRWSNLKESPPEVFQSPLILLPVELTCRKGVQDTHVLRLLNTEAEVNPVVRYLFRQLYAIELPETLELSTDALLAFHERLAAQIAATDRGVSLNLIDQPRIALMHDKARRRVDQYRRRVRISGLGVKSFCDLDYSYDAMNYHPLGIRLFNDIVRPATSHLRKLIGTGAPRPRFAVPPDDEPDGGAETQDAGNERTGDGQVVEAERSFFTLTESDQNPFVWEIDLCNVTLANMKYRKMSLVRDYAELVGANSQNPAFDAVFSLTPRVASQVAPPPLPLAERFHVVSCDPTQAQALADARTKASYIIQGPPGTGKSQTITNLIADYVARGLRVLFVCEKRAAIDVVFQRLKQRKLHELCCLIHDSQADKKDFVLDLKATYEGFLQEAVQKRDQHKQQREQVIAAVSETLQPLEGFNSAMCDTLPNVGTPLRRMFERLVELGGNVPELSPAAAERLPHYADWETSRPQLERIYQTIGEIQPDGVLARHALSRLSSAVADAERPIEYVGGCLQRTRALASQLGELLAQVDWPGRTSANLTAIDEIVAYADAAQFLARRRLIQLTEKGSELAKVFSKRVKALSKLERERETRRQETTGWKNKLSREDTRAALEQARALEGNWLAFLSPGWWRLRGIFKRAFDFSGRMVRPTWVEALQCLDNEHTAQAEYQQAEDKIREDLGISSSLDEFRGELRRFVESLPQRSEAVGGLHTHLLESEQAGQSLRRLHECRSTLDKLLQQLRAWLTVWQDLRPEELLGALSQIEGALPQLPDYVHCLRDLAGLNERLSTALRSLPLSGSELEEATARHTLDDVYRANRDFKRFDGVQRERLLKKLNQSWSEWQEVNAEAIREVVRQRFLDHVHLTEQPAANLTAEQKEFKKTYSRGRRELEHEFSKTMRYRAIRDLVDDETGMVVRDLKPVWLMSPLSVSDTLPLDDTSFDVVIFDEASQITLEEAVPSLFRARQTIVVGDEMQLPPTDFFSAKSAGEEDGVMIEDNGEVVAYDLNSDSLLNHAGRNLLSRMLGWHYRSRSESLISFSNRRFYDGRLLTVPDEAVVATRRQELIVNQTEDALRNATELQQRAVSFHFLPTGVYDKRKNRKEADYIAELVRQLLRTEPRRSVGVIAFSEAQQEEIDQALRRLAEADQKFGEELETELERIEDGQFVGLLVKNLENIQGDERDIVILSVCYGPDPQGRVRMNFGPINRSGGEKRLNVAFSRAKHHMVLVSSLRHTAITNEYNEGANCLKNYLRYAEAASIGEEATLELVLKSLLPAHSADAQTETDAIVAQIAAALRERGWQVDENVGQSRFRCDLAVRGEGDNAYRLGILVDTAAWYAQTDLIERELLKPSLLKSFGWKIAVVLAKDWYHDSEGVIERIVKELG